MELDCCTPGQRETILTLDAPLMVAAGAGSGKTFTLTQRIVHAFTSKSGTDGEPFVTSIDEVVAITFTRKAAAELRSRIKALLVQEGFGQEALDVDDGWITTIHGMAARILRENALEIGIDPAFEVISESLQEELRREAVESILEEASSLDDDALRTFLASEPLFGRGEHGRGLVDDAQSIIDRAMSMPEGLDGVVVASQSRMPSRMIAYMVDRGETFLAQAQEWIKPGKNEQKVLDDMNAAIEAARIWLETLNASEFSFADDAFDAEGFRAVLYAFPFSGGNAPTKKNRTEFFDEYNEAYAKIAAEAEAALGERRARHLLRFAHVLDERYEELLGPHRFDQSGLLRRCVRALEDHPDIAARYRDRFKLIMVDEFQDTDNLQVKLIALLAQPALANVCVVGDAQQSIYRFRGADVNVFFDYEKHLAEVNPSARFPKLADNFRSHRDVLGFVDKVFSQPEAFGKRFLRLDAKGRVNRDEHPAFAGSAGAARDLPRVTLDVVAYDPRARNETKVSSAEATRVAAEHVADHFARLKESDIEPKDMALLLGSMRSADVFAEALRARGIESIIAGGSVFSRTRAAGLVGALLRCAVNREDGPALFEVLTSPLFALSDDCLLFLSSRYDDFGKVAYCDLAEGLVRAAVEEHHDGLSDNDARALDVALSTLNHFVRAGTRSERGSASRALRELFVHTGLLDRLQAQGASGAAQAGNLQKACFIVEDLERDATGIASLSYAYDEHLRTATEAPGILSFASSLPLRIMTIHASKGLQFAHVAVAEAGDGKRPGQGLIVENVGESTYVSNAAPLSKPPAHRGMREKLHAVLKESDERWIESAHIAEALATDARSLDAGSVRMALAEWARQEALSEAQRLLYVALTRAVESIYLQVRLDAKSDDDYAAAGVYARVFTAFPWDPAAQRSRDLVDFGGTAPAEVRYEKLVGPLDAAGADDSDGRREDACGGQAGAQPFIVPVREQMPLPHMVPHGFARENVRSYSSLDHDAFAETHGISSPGEVEADDASVAHASLLDGEQEQVALLSYGSDEDATALGTAFHRLAQRAIVIASHENAPYELVMPEEAAIEAQIRMRGLSEGQCARLLEALDRWFNSTLAYEFGEHAHIAAEVPFMIRIEREGDAPLYLEGEIDGLADNGDGRAFFIDYKTGGSPDETEEQLHVKHAQQAQCYAYALMREGYTGVEARFVRVEQPDADDPSQPSVVKYSFTADDMAALEYEITAAAR